ncbi:MULTISPECIES: rhomboid family intramembrane serine protease [Haloprofundus]|uniref:rhomboid family intramembrane serine protease n=1 Tax=Haloprofundus TaxID=1911573 RepID=UPI000E44F566|nr:MULTISPECIES: rhomboid family intramembrane serine protease [Haloprofundus]QCJ47587.1 rhomboid family intramembrane serine protease [Haloprofundus sp. MHR1]
MAECHECGEYENLPYQCRRCGNTFCAEHRLPENHNCPGMGEWDDPSGVFESSFDDSVGTGGSSDGVLDRLTGTGGPLGYFRGNMTYVFLGLMWITFISEYIVGYLLTGGLPPNGAGVTYYGTVSETWRSIFLLTSENPEYVWTWFTSILAHGGFFHIAANSIVLYFFGPLVERYLGAKRFTALFLASGAIAGLAQIGTALATGEASAVLGASGAAMAVLGLLTVVNPDLRVMLLIPPIPLPIWALTGFYVLFDLTGAITPIFGGGIAHYAHLAGLLVGLLVGQYVKGQQQIPNRLNFGGGNGGMGGGRRRY